MAWLSSLGPLLFSHGNRIVVGAILGPCSRHLFGHHKRDLPDQRAHISCRASPFPYTRLSNLKGRCEEIDVGQTYGVLWQST